ncbi:hypothetical protein ACIPWI_19445 [Streptomyces sp. NPDC090046]|uniref:hypothetical protein n=1 Tax=Streptomyces sp. NPDC090046 TaxID=3365928 RepID=UPI00382B10ED
MIFRGTAAGTDGPPTTARLRAVLNRAARVVIVEGQVPSDEDDSTGAPRIDVTGADLADLAELLAIVDGGTGDRCRCNGWPTIMVHDANGELIARWTLHHQTGIRGLGDCDADLRDGPALTEWLAGHGLTGSREAQAELAAEEAVAERRRARWVRSAPDGLTEAAEAVAQPPGRDGEAWSRDLRDAEDRLAALTRRLHPDGIERIRALLAWAGIPAREPTGGLMWYDRAVELQLLAEPSDLIFAACAAQPPTPAQLDGAAGLFGSLEWTGAHGRQLPEPLKSLLIAHIEAQGTEPMRFRMRHGYYGAERTV